MRREPGPAVMSVGWSTTSADVTIDAGLLMDAGLTIETESAGTSAADVLVEELFASEVRSLVRLARIFCDDRDGAEDLVQEAYIRLHRSAGSIRDASRAPAFLRSIVINLARDHNRRGLMSLRHQGAMRRPEVAPSFEDEALAEADHETLGALRTLSDRQRACLVLRYYLDLSEREIADTLGISKNSVKTHTRRGLAALEARLGPSEQQEADV
jgi:RNA polymerase sigma factor (sigma-70 family)